MRPSRQFQLILMLLTLVSATILGYLVVWLASGGQSAELARRQAVLSAAAERATETAVAEAEAPPIDRLTSTPGPTPTFVPVSASSIATPPGEAPVEPSPELSPEAPTEPAIEPSSEPPTESPATPIPRIEPTVAPIAPDPIIVNGPAVRLEDTAWQGGFRQGRGYGGRSATWIYGQSTGYTSMQTVLVLDTPPSGTATLTIEGMDSEDRVKTPIRITVNGREIFDGPNPLPNDDLPLATGTWASHAFPFDAALLQPGRNVIRISNLAQGSFGLPPFFMLDYAVLGLPTAARQAPPPATVTLAAPTEPPTDTPPPPTDTPAPPTDTPSLPTDAPAPSDIPTAEPTSEPTAAP